jgi:hypothetical protein
VRPRLFASILFCLTLALDGLAALPPPQMTFLDNGQVRVGMDLALGGAITFISSKDHPGNIINSADLGRQIQMSHYSGPWPFAPYGKMPRNEWAGLGWNPIQTGDCYGNPSWAIEHRNNGKEIYIKCIPMQWPLDKVLGDCIFETWTRLEGPLIHMRFRCTNQRPDRTSYHPCPQELPAVYTISKLCHLASYIGQRPFTEDRLTWVSNDWRKPWPWTRFVGTERWAALVDDVGWGLGVFKDDGGQFDGGIYGDGRSDDPKDSSTGYLAPIHLENFDYNIVYEHRTEFMVGTLSDIPKRFNRMATRSPPNWRFAKDRQHWTLRDAVDQGFPLRGAWRITFGTKKPMLESGVRCWRAEAAPWMTLKLACRGSAMKTRVYWKCLDNDSYDAARSCIVNLNSDGKLHSYHLNLGALTCYSGLITGLALSPENEPNPGDQWAIDSISFNGSP